MKSRLNQLPDNRLLQQITTMQQTLAALKTAQTAGSTDVQLTDVVTGSPVDFTVTVPPLAQTIWEITFTPNDTTFDFTGWVWHLFLTEPCNPVPSHSRMRSKLLYLLGPNRLGGFISSVPRQELPP